MAFALTAAVNGTLRHVGGQIRQHRLRRQLTLAQVGKAIGVSPSMLSMAERGLAMPSIGTLVAISEVLQVPMSALFDAATGPPVAAVPVVRRAQQPVFAAPQGVKRRLGIRDQTNDIELAENSYPAADRQRRPPPPPPRPGVRPGAFRPPAHPGRRDRVRPAGGRRDHL